MTTHAENPYSAPLDAEPRAGAERPPRGPGMYLATGGLLGAAAALPLVAPVSLEADPNPLGYLLTLLGVPAGGIAYRIRSRNWPADSTARIRVRWFAVATLLLPATIAALTRLRGQGMMLTVAGCIISASLISGMMLAGSRRAPRA